MSYLFEMLGNTYAGNGALQSDTGFFPVNSATFCMMHIPFVWLSLETAVQLVKVVYCLLIKCCEGRHFFCT